MKKFILTRTGEEVKIGDTIEGTKIVENSFGTIEVIHTIKISINNIDSLIRKGIIKSVEVSREPDASTDMEIKSKDDSVGFYIKLLAMKYKRSVKDISEWLNDTNKVCPKAVLDILLQEIAWYFYNIDVNGFDNAEIYYSLRPKDGKVGKVANVSTYIPLFKSVEDAEKARKILKKQLELMYGE